MFQMIICLLITIVSHKFMGLSAVVLLVELNTIFLHLRQLLKLVNIDRSGRLYIVNSIINLGRCTHGVRVMKIQAFAQY